jgi:4-diphosphocytidyl-2-C-methyl-D-erythritol kinase
MRETAYAKLNLALHVRAREADGYHRLETLFAFAEHGDEIAAEPADRLTLKVTGPFAEGLDAGPSNLVLRAAAALADHAAPGAGARLRLHKTLPVAAGIGGGSADAAAALRLLVRLWDLRVGEDALLAIARTLGADVPACLLSRTVRGEGRGDRLAPVDLPGLAGAPLLLVNPRRPLSTAQVFRAWDGIDCGPLGADWRAARNDLEAPAMTLEPAIGAVLAALAGAPFVRMSGSGATCFALYDDPAARDAAAARIAADHPGWWRLATRLRGSGEEQQPEQ